jgi:hypothetical protein
MRIGFVFALVFVVYSIYAQKPKLKESEIKGVKKIDFYNRSNSRASFKYRQEQIDLGKTLSRLITQTPSKKHIYKGVQVQRFVSQKEGVMGGDILSLEENTNYGHIHSIQRFLSAYIQDAFEFSEDNADTIALFALYYNAIHRNEKSYFREKYISDLYNTLEVEKTGISTNYKDWAGGTQIVIPIDYSVARGKQDLILEEIVTEVGKNPTVIPIKEEDKKKIEEIIIERKKEDEKLIKINEEKLEPKKETITAKPESPTRKEATSSKLENPLPKKEVTSSKSEIPTETKIEKPIVKKEKTESTTNTKTLQETPPAKKEETSIALLPKKEEQPPTPSSKEKELEKQVQELKKENETFKTKEKEREEKSENIMGDKVLFLRLVKYEDDGHYTNELWVLDATNEQTLYKSPYTNICGKEFHVINEGVVVIGFDGNRPIERVHRLVLLDPNTLSQTKVTKEEIFWRSHIVYREGKIYAFEKYKNEVYLSRFNGNLTLEARSSEPVGTNSELSFYKDRVFLTGKPSNQEETVIRILQKDDLKVLKTIKPMETKKRK